MKLSSIPQFTRNAKRFREIVRILGKYGLANWIRDTDPDFLKGLFTNADGTRLSEQTQEARVRMALTELGPTFIKLGQILSTRPDLIGPMLAAELTKLQSRTPPDRPDVVRAEAQLVAATARIGVAEALRYPSIFLTGSLGFESTDLSDLNSSDARSWNIGANIFSPIFNSGQRKAQAEAAREQAEQSLLLY